MFFNKKEREIKKVFKTDNGGKLKLGCKKNFATIFVFFILFTILFTTQMINLVKNTNLNIDDLIFDINIEEKLTTPYNDNDFLNAKNKLNEIGLHTLSNKYIITNLENNVEMPTKTLNLTNAEFASLLVPIFYAKYGKLITIYEIEIKEKLKDSYNIKITSKTNLKFSYKSLSINEDIYSSEYYLLKKDNGILTLTFLDIDFLNINYEYIKKEDLIKDAEKDNDIQKFIKYVFITESESKSYINQLNYNNFDMLDNQIILS